MISEGRITVESRADPVPQGGELLVKVRAAGLNGADILQRKGQYPLPPYIPADAPGLEFAGEVIGAGPGATRFPVGARVMGLVAARGQADMLVVNERIAMLVPDSVGWPAAGGFPEVFITAHDALFSQAQLRPGENLLVHGAAGGVGSAAVQLGRLIGARVTGTVRTDGARAAVSAWGAKAIDVGSFLNSGPYDVILELVDAHNLTANLSVLSSKGRIMVVGVGPDATTQIDLLELIRLRASVHGSTLRIRTLEEKALASRRLETEVLPALASGTLTVPIAATFQLSDAARAYEFFEAGGKVGKVVLVM
jgi:NADPH:quinone reductase-like Zn-dependent oxidoreductase